MAVVIDGTLGISPVTASGTSASVDGMTVGRGGGEVSTNTAVGLTALNATATGGFNTGVGANSLKAVTSGTTNTATGHNSLTTNTTGSSNAAFGQGALELNTTGGSNTALGYNALEANTTASYNTAVGYQAGNAVTTGQYNCLLGYITGTGLTTGGGNTFVGGGGCATLVTTGSNNTVIGNYSGNSGGLDIRTSSNYIVLSDGAGNPRIYIAGTNGYFFPNIRSSADANNDLRFNTANGEIYYQTSSQRYKENIVDLEFDTSNLYNLRPVSYDDKATGNRCYGLIAEETFVQIPDVVVKRDIDGEILPDSIPYSMLSVVIINEMKKLKTIVDAQATEITALKAKVGI